MTRFARSRGSKASNERLPEEATPWSQMKQQLQQREQQKHDETERARFEDMRDTNYKNFLKEQKEKAVVKSWCTFDDANLNDVTSGGSSNKSHDKMSKTNKSSAKSTPKSKTNKTDENDKKLSKKINNGTLKIKSKQCEKSDGSDNPETQNSGSEIDADDEELKKWCDEYSDTEINDQYDDLTLKLNEILKNEKKGEKKKEKKQKSSVNDNEIQNDNKNTMKKIHKKQKMAKATVSDMKENTLENDSVEDKSVKFSIQKSSSKFEKMDVEEVNDYNKVENESGKKNKKRKINQTNFSEEPSIKSKKKKTNKQEAVDENIKNLNTTLNKKKGKTNLDKENSEKKDHKDVNDGSKDMHETKINNQLDKNKKEKMTKAMKIKSKPGEFIRRKPIENNKIFIIVNGEEMEVQKYDGFPVLSKDVERLKQLRKDLISKGIPRSEVDRTMKLQRRAAEKRLSQIKKKLCFHCREAGHNLSDCPKLSKEEKDVRMPSSGICFKCGSTEHTHFACKVVRTQDYKFAQCFICKEQGHISKQCPDNPRGIYPKGGACRVCGDVTHLKKDCPKVVQEREKTSMKLDVMESNNIEDIAVQSSEPKSQKISKVKHVKF